MANDWTTGWTLTAGTAGERIGSGVTIYASTSLLDPIYTGVDKEDAIANTLGVSPEEAAKAIEAYNNKKLEYSDAKADLDLAISAINQDTQDKTSDVNTLISEQNMLLRKKVGGTKTGNTIRDALIDETKGLTPEEEARLVEVTKEINDRRIILENALAEKEKLEEDFNKKWGDYEKLPTSTLYDAVKEDSPIVKAQEQKEKELDALTKTLQQQTASSTSIMNSSSMASWFDAMEQYIDGMPQMNEVNTPLYEVTKKGNWWVYTGVTATPDPEYNRVVREFKQRQCKKLNNIMNKTTEWSEKQLNAITKKLAGCGPIIKAIQIIQKGLSLKTLVSFGKGVIDFCTAHYQMIYGAYQSAMQILELIVIRVPRLVSKIISKVVEFNCPITVKPISVKFEASPEAANKKKSKKNG